MNVQTAKTKVYDEIQSEISRLLIDDRVDGISRIIGDIQQQYPKVAVPKTARAVYLESLAEIAKKDTPGGQKIIGAKVPLEGLSIRAFHRWVTAHKMLDSEAYVKRLLTEISRSADSRLTGKLIATTRRFPRKRGIENAVMKMIKEGQIIFPHQEAECLRALRYLSTLTHDTVNHCWKCVTQKTGDRYLRMEAAYLLSRTELNPGSIKKLLKIFWSEPDAYVQAALACLLVQRRENNQEIVQMLVLHPNEKVRDIGKLFRTVKNKADIARKTLRHALRPEVPWILCDNMPFLHLMSVSQDNKVRELLLEAIRKPRNHHEVGGLRVILKAIYTRTREFLASTTT